MEKEPIFNLKLNIISSERNLNLPINPEQQDAMIWYAKEVARLPEYKVEEHPLTGSGGWEAKFSQENPQIVDLIEGRHFSLVGRKISTSGRGWNQPIIKQRSEVLINQDGEKDRVSGIVLLLKDSCDRIFVSVAQEPEVPASVNAEGEEIHPVVRSPFQSSIEKLQQLTEGNEKADPLLYSILSVLQKDSGGNLQSIIEDIPFTKEPTDGNRIESNVLYGTLKLNEEAANLICKENPRGKFLSENQLKILNRNGHLSIALFSTSIL